MSKPLITIERHIIEAEREFPEATGAFSNILYDIAFSAKMISREVRRAGLADILGYTGEVNIQGEEVRKLDGYANEVIFKSLDHSGHLCGMASEEEDDFIPIPDRFPTGNYCVLFDPLDGSSNIDANVSVGTIFSIHRKISDHARGCVQDCLQAGVDQVAAGYVVYGSSTMLVYTTGNGVHGFTLEPSIGEFLLSHPNIRIPTPGERIYSVNEGNWSRWPEEMRRLIGHLKGEGEQSGSVPAAGPKPFSARYVGSLVADFHRNLLYGGIFMYPADSRAPQGKLRLLYEAAPLAMLCEQAGGRASDGARRIMEIQPTQLHERTPLFIGTAEYVEMAERFLAGSVVAAVA